MARGWRCLLALAVLMLGACAGDDDEGEASAPSPSGGQAAVPAVADPCALIPPEVVARAVSVPAGILTVEPQPANPARGLACNYVDSRRRILFVLQVQDAADAAGARRLLDQIEGSDVDDLGDEAEYQETGNTAATLGFVKGRRAVFLISQAQVASREVLLGLARPLAARV